MLKKMFAMLVICTAVISMQANAGSTTTVYCGVDTDGWDFDYDYTIDSCGDYCKMYFFDDLYASGVDGIAGQIKSDTEYYWFGWYYSKNDGASWYLGGYDEDCDWAGGYYVCSALQTGAYEDWTWEEPATVLRFQYIYTSGGATYTRYFWINQIVK